MSGNTGVIDFMTGNPQLGVWSGSLTYHANPRLPALVRPAATQNGPAPSSSLPEHVQHSELLCITSVPAYMIPTDMLQFVAPFLTSIQFVRILRPCDKKRAPDEYIVLVQVDDQATAQAFLTQYDGVRFSSMEETMCNVVMVSSIEFEGQSFATHRPALRLASDPLAANMALPPDARARLQDTAAAQSPHTPTQSTGRVSPAVFFRLQSHSASTRQVSAGTYDSAVCVICMERLDSKVMTTVCNHSFHISCLIKWQDSPCPVCRFHHNSASEESTCQDCGSTVDLWVCLICGFVGCGRRNADHSRLHYFDSLHTYALEIDSQQVWDFAGDGFVHRLIHNKADGKMVEMADPAQYSEERPTAPQQLSDAQEERLVHGKLEGLAYQYNTLLTSQLEEQRRFYQKQMDRLLRDQDQQGEERPPVSGSDLVTALRQEVRHLQQRCIGVSGSLDKAREESAFLEELNLSLKQNQSSLADQLRTAEVELANARDTVNEWVPRLEAKVQALMLKLDGQAGGGGVGGGSDRTPRRQRSRPSEGALEEKSCGSGQDAEVVGLAAGECSSGDEESGQVTSLPPADTSTRRKSRKKKGR